MKREKGALKEEGSFVFTGIDGLRQPFKIYAHNWREFLDKASRDLKSNNLIKVECERVDHN